MIPSFCSWRAVSLRVTRVIAVVSSIPIAFAACDSNDPVGPPGGGDPASVVSMSITPTAVPVVKGGTITLTVSALDSAGRPVITDVTWTSSAPLAASVSKQGVVSALGFGPATITATIGSHSASAEVVVTAAPTERVYSVLDLGPALPIGGMTRQLSDSGDVIAGGKLYHGGVATSMAGCTNPVTINGPGHVLCRIDVYDSVSSYAVWHDGTLTPLAGADTFKAEHFRAFALDDSNEVAALVYNPSFSNAKCATPGARCLSIWKNGVVSFPGLNASAEVMLMNSAPQVVLQDPIYGEYHSSPAIIYDVATGTQRTTPWGIQALNDKGWAAIAQQYIQREPTALASTAEVATPGAVVVLGSGAASGVNNDNVVVGTLTVGPFIWRGGGVSLLNNATVNAGWTITAADEINSRGQILARADNSAGGKDHTVILTPAQP